MRVVIMGGDYCSLLGMIRAVGDGNEITVLRTEPFSSSGLRKNLKNWYAVERKSRYVSAYYTVKADEKELISFLLEKCRIPGEKVLLIPTADFHASVIDMNQDVLAKDFLFPHINGVPGEVTRMMDKSVQKQMARAVGFPVAEGITVEVKDRKFVLPDSICYPCFTKPEISNLGHKNFIQKCESESELLDVLRQVAEYGDCPVLVEQYIDIAHEYGILGFADKGKAFIPGIVQKTSIGTGPRRGVTMVGKYSPIEPYGDVGKKLEKLLAQTSFTGLFDIDLYESNGVIYFNELNMRLGAFGYAAVCAGVNLPQRLIRCLQGLDYSDMPATIRGEVECLNDKVCLEDYYNGFQSWREFKEKIKYTPYTFIRSEDDPAPGRVFHRYARLIRARRIITRIKRKNGKY